MSTEERLSEIEYQKKRMELNRRFVEMYEDEVSYILEQKEDIEIMEKLSGEEAKLISEEARKYNRIFARFFMIPQADESPMRNFCPSGRGKRK